MPLPSLLYTSPSTPTKMSLGLGSLRRSSESGVRAMGVEKLLERKHEGRACVHWTDPWLILWRAGADSDPTCHSLSRKSLSVPRGDWHLHIPTQCTPTPNAQVPDLATCPTSHVSCVPRLLCLALLPSPHEPP